MKCQRIELPVFTHSGLASPRKCKQNPDHTTYILSQKNKVFKKTLLVFKTADPPKSEVPRSRSLFVPSGEVSPWHLSLDLVSAIPHPLFSAWRHSARGVQGN